MEALVRWVLALYAVALTVFVVAELYNFINHQLVWSKEKGSILWVFSVSDTVLLAWCAICIIF